MAMASAMQRGRAVRDGCGGDRNRGRDRNRDRAVGLAWIVVALCSGARAESAPPPPGATVTSPTPRRWSLVERVIAQDQGDWRVDYRLRLDAGPEIVLAPGDLGAAVDGWVSNSRVAAHAVPRRSNPRVVGASGSGTSTYDTIPAPDDAKACRERLVFRAWSADGPEPAPRPRSTPPTAPDPIATVSIAPGGVLCIRLRLEHEHFLHGPYDPMLGLRDVTLTIGPTTVADVLPLDREHYLAQAREAWPPVPDDRRDTRHFVSGPDSLHLEAHVPGNQYYRFPERAVRYSTRMKLTFWYLIAPGGEGEFRVRIAQYKDSPTGWQVLHQGSVEQGYGVVGRWTKVERIFKTEAEATSLAVDFKIHGADVGEVWVDDVKLEPLAGQPGGP